MPGDNLNEIGHERGYQTLDNRRIAPNHVLLVHIGLVVLRNNCKWFVEGGEVKWSAFSLEFVLYEESHARNTCATLMTFI